MNLFASLYLNLMLGPFSLPSTGEKCEGLAVNNCDYQNKCMTSYKLEAESAPKCQAICRTFPDTVCNTFEWDSVSGECLLFICRINEYADTCDVIGGPENADPKECDLEGPTTCASFRYSECTFEGEFQGASASSTVQECHNACEPSTNCDVFVFLKGKRLCQFYSKGAARCQKYIGPKSPSLEECLAIPTEAPPPEGSHVIIKTVDAATNEAIAEGQVVFSVVGQAEGLKAQGEGLTDMEGKLDAGYFPYGTVLNVLVKKDGFHNAGKFFTLESKPEQTLSMALSTIGPLRVVLSWNSEPQDLDLHSLAINRDDGSIPCHVHYGFSTCLGSHLNVDNREGGDNGPETITYSDSEKYIYAIYIQHFSYDSARYPLASSGATLDIYGGMSSLQFQVPKAEPEVGTTSLYWMVGCLDPLNDKLFQLVDKLLVSAKIEDLAKECPL